jgi:hemolysin type calcium-binding protein
MNRRLGSGLGVAAAASILAFAAVPGAAQARTDDDYRCAGQPVQSKTIVCTALTEVFSNQPDGSYDDNYTLGGPDNSETLTADDPRQCMPGYYLWWSRDYDHAVDSYLWQWDYYVKGGSWVLWNGPMPGEWPENFELPGGQTGLVSIAASFSSWYGGTKGIPTRVFWLCAPLSNPSTYGVGGPGSTAPSGAAPVGLHRVGGKSDDTLRGDEADNAVIGGAGNDRLSGRNGDDHLHGGPGADALAGGDGHDLLHGALGDDMATGGDGNDDILTGKGNDTALGGKGGDQLFDDHGRDRLHGGRGNDRFSARDGHRDVIDCGPGEDIAIIDRFDVAVGCEHAYRTRAETPDTPPKLKMRRRDAK